MDMIGKPSPRSQRKRRVAHATWAAIAIPLSVFMIFTKQRGDPPMMVFVPLVCSIWVVGHFVIWTVQWLAVRGQRMVIETGGERKPWPIGLRLVLIGTGVPVAVGIFQVLMSRWQRN